MKRYSKHNILCHLTLLAIAGSMLSACVDDEEMLSPLPSLWTQGLTVQPYIEGSKMATRAYNYYDDDTYNNYPIGDDVPADDELKENDLGTRLDVFIAGQGNDPFWMQYHLVQGQVTTNGVAGVQASVLNETADLLAKNWTDVEDPNGNKLVSGQKYDVYVAVNNTATNATIASKEALLALTYNNGVVYKLYGTTTTGAFDASRRMLMDGHIEWTCQNLPLQKIEVPLKRAEAKVVITVDFSPAFMAQLREDTGLDTPIGIPSASAPFTGAPAWKYVNWCMDTKVFADGNDITPTLNTDEGRENMTENSLLNEQHYYYYNGKEMQEDGTLSTDTDTEVYFTDYDDDTDEYGRKYIDLYPVADELSDGHSVERTANNVPRAHLITYTYTTSWDHHADERAPYVLVSYPFYRKKEGVTTVSSSNDLITTFNYYRIPVCDEQANTELKRNYIYKVNAIISGAGSTSFTENEANVKLHYEVLPWTHDADEDVKVKGESFHYFYVTPTTYNLRGDNTQSVNLNYYAAKGDVVKFKNLQVYYYNSSGTKVYIYGETTDERNAEFTEKELTGNNNAGKNYKVTINSDGTIFVSSDALDNRAVKYITFTAYMTYVDEEGHTQTMTEDIVIKHFPLDNIQNVEGSWSSKYSSYTMGEQDVTETTYNPAIGETWKNDAGYSKIEEECNSTDQYISRTDKVEGSRYNYDTKEPGESNQNEFHSNVTSYWSDTQNERRRNANSEANNYNGYWGEDPVVTTGNDYDYYEENQVSEPATRNDFRNNAWDPQNANSAENADYYGNGYYGTNPVQSNSNDYDYYTGRGNNRRYYKYSQYWHVTTETTYYKYTSYWKYTYWRTTYYRNLYSHTVRKMVPTVTSNWVMWDTDQSLMGYQTDKITNDNLMNAKYYQNGNIYLLRKNDWGRLTSSQYQLSNNHMYIIQISSTSDQYVLGRPVVNSTTHQSNDHVVSPAFMIASQLGALSQGSTTDASVAATHCAQYMEVATDGTKYVGWRLPTKEEISVIIKYQSDDSTSESMATVLSDCNYYALDGSAAWTGLWEETYDNLNRIPFIRCVRDLSPEEIAAINSKQ